MRTLAALIVLALAASVAHTDDSAQQPPAARTPEQAANLRKGILEGLADPHPKKRAAAADVIVAAWPDSAAILDEALSSQKMEVRIEAVRVLERAELGDVRERLVKKFSDTSEGVRRQAVRVARRLKWPEVEPHLIEIVSYDKSWPVRQEALRGLEDRGTTKCLRTVLDRWAAETDVDHRIRWKRVLVAVVGGDHGDDLGAWRAAINEAEEKARSAHAK